MKRKFSALILGLFFVVLIAVANNPKTLPAVSNSFADNPKLILDPGHGGVDGGASSAAGNKESDINLAIVLKMESLCAFLGIETILTRSEDVSIHDESCETIREKKVSDLKNRAFLIQNTPNAMVISVHQNTFTDPACRGTQVFYGSGECSVQWAEYTQQLFQRSIDPMNQRSASGIPEHVYLFKHIECPAILVECGFLSNATDVALLLTDAYQLKLATVLTCAYLHQLQMVPNPLGGE